MERSLNQTAPVRESSFWCCLAWFNRIGLDAPCVAVGWYLLLVTERGRVDASADGNTIAFDDSKFAGAAAQFGSAEGSVSIASALFLMTWLVYLGDRWLDRRSLDFSRNVTDRHAFVNRWAGFLAVLWFGLLVLQWAIVMWGIRPDAIRLGAPWVSTVIGYLAVVHWGRRRRAGDSKTRRWVPKEILVGCLFAAGVAVSVSATACQNQTWPDAVWQSDRWAELSGAPVSLAWAGVTEFVERLSPWPLFLLSGLFTWNCLLVASVQSAVDRDQSTPSMVTRFPALTKWLSFLSGVLLAVASWAWMVEGISSTFFAAFAFSCVGMGVLNQFAVPSESPVLAKSPVPSVAGVLVAGQQPVEAIESVSTHPGCSHPAESVSEQTACGQQPSAGVSNPRSLQLVQLADWICVIPAYLFCACQRLAEELVWC